MRMSIRAKTHLPQRTKPVKYEDLDPFVRSYVNCALWSSIDDEGEPLDTDTDGHDLPSVTLEKMKADCDAFRVEAGIADLLAHAGDDSQNGHDFWLTRNRHGAGFWDRGYGKVGRKLTDAAHAWGECDIYREDDGLVYIS